MWQKLQDNKDWVFIIVGGVLIFFAVLNLINFNPLSLIENIQITPAVDQQGFAPLFIPKEAAEELPENQASQSLDIPERIVIEKINLDAPVKMARSVNVTVDEKEVTQFLVPEEFAAGWHEGSAPLGNIGNTVISGHHNAFGKVFEHLVDLEIGDSIILLSGPKQFDYIIANRMILPEKDEPLEVRLNNGRWILQSNDERLTLVTCWPEKSNTHRLILVAVPATTQYPISQPAQTPEAVELFYEVTPEPLNLLTQTDEPEAVPQEFIVRNSGRFSVNIRENPDILGEIIGSFKPGKEAIGLGRTIEGDWIFITIDDISGWVSAELVEILLPVESLPTLIPPKLAP